MYRDNKKAAPARTARRKNRQKQSYQKWQNHQGKFVRTALPTPATVLQKLNISQSGGVNHAGYLALRCPFHKNGQEQHPSLNIHVINGHYKCHACGAHGGDVLAFYMAATGKGFREAAHDLGAWR